MELIGGGFMRVTRHEDLAPALEGLRSRLEQAFSADTAAPGFPTTSASAGHCAAVSAIIGKFLGAEMVSARVDGLSHWFNRMSLGDEQLDFDLTGDQFGLPVVQIARAGELYAETRVRAVEELNVETLQRASRLAQRANLPALGECTG